MNSKNNKPPVLNIKIRQAIILILISFLAAILVNSVRTDSLPWVAESIEAVESENSTWIDSRGFGIVSITLDQARQLYENGTIFVDARPKEYFDAGHIKGALSNHNFRELIYNLDQSQTRLEPVVLYCDGNDCQLSEELAYDLEIEGFLSLYVFSGGWDEWVKKGLPVVK